ncbi:MAG: DMT family transporter [Myxococcales bacterium]|nr:DMT family transporter [Myxococcales bacterium]
MNGLVLGLVSALLFGASTPASKVLLADLTPFQLAGLLYLGAALGVALPVALERRRALRVRLDARNRARLAGAVFFGGVLGPVLLLMGLRTAAAASVSLILNLEMAATAALGAFVFREPLHRAGWIGVTGIVAAGALLSGEAGWPGVASGLLVAAACVCWGFDNHLTALIDGITPATSTLVKGVAAGTTNLCIGAALAPVQASWPTAGAALAVGAICYGASISLYIASAQQLGATRAQGLFASAPFFGAALSFAVLGETPAPVHAAAGALLALSVLLLFRSQHGHEHTHEAAVHIHSHRHDDGHHGHAHSDLPASTRHTHRHRHAPFAHAHPHWPDLHHRHRH